MKLILWKYGFVIFVLTFAFNVVLVDSSKEKSNTSLSNCLKYSNQKRAKLYEKDEIELNEVKKKEETHIDSELLVNKNNSGYLDKTKSHKSKPISLLSTKESDDGIFGSIESQDSQYSCYYPTRYLRLECSSTNYIFKPVFDDEDDSKYIKCSININNNKFIKIIDEEKGIISINQSDVQQLSFVQISCSYIESDNEEDVNNTLLLLNELENNSNTTTFNLLIEILYSTIPTDIFPLKYPKYFISDKIVNDPMIYGIFFPFSIPNIPLTVIKTLKNSTYNSDGINYYYLPNILQTQMEITSDQSYLNNYGIADFTFKVLIKTIKQPETDISVVTFTVNTYTLEREYSYLIYNENITNNNNNNNSDNGGNITYINQYTVSLTFNFISLLNISDSIFLLYFDNEIYDRYFKQFILNYNESNSNRNKDNQSIIYSSYGDNNMNISFPNYSIKFEISIIPIIKNETIDNNNNNTAIDNSKRILQSKNEEKEEAEKEERITHLPIFQLYSIIQSIQSNLTLKDKQNKNLIFLDTFYSDYKVTEIPIFNSNYNDSEDDQTEVEEIKPPSESNKKKKVNTAAIVIPIILVVIIIIIIVAVVIWYFYYYKRNKSDQSKETFSGVFERHKSSKVNGDYDPYIKDKVLHEGYLWKEGRNRIAYKFQKRYVVIYKEPAIMRIYESMCPSFYGNVYIHEKQSIPMECFRCVEKESQIQFMCRFAVQNSQKKQMSLPEQSGICDERIFRFKNNNSNLETAIRQTEEWIQILREFEKQNARPKPIQVWYDNQTLKRDAEENNKLLPVSTPTSKHSSSSGGNTRVSSAIASASRRKRALEIKRQLRTPQRLGLTSNTLVSTRGSVGCEIELNQLQDYDSDTFRTPKYSSTTRTPQRGRNSELTLHDLPKNNNINNSNINRHFISPTRLFQNRKKKKDSKTATTITTTTSGTSSGEEEEEEEDRNNNNNYRKKGLSEGDRSILHPFIKNKNINLPPIAPLKTPIPTLQINTERDGYSSTKLSSQLVSRKQTRDSEEDGKIDLDDDGISEK